MTEPRQIIVVDVETNGLDPSRHTTVEVAWWNLSTGDRGAFVPPHDISATLATADIQALQVNRYVDRLATAEQDDEGPFAAQLLWEALSGSTLAGSNPAFDARFLAKMFTKGYKPYRAFYDGTPWHHRLLDLSAYAAGVLGLPPSVLPGLSTVCKHLDVALVGAHTAAGDVTATGECFRKLFDRSALSALSA